MSLLADTLWCVALAPLAVSGLILLWPGLTARGAGLLALGGLAVSLLHSLASLIATLGAPGEVLARNLPWFQAGGRWVHVGWVLDPLSALMLAMVAFVGCLVFLYSMEYMARDEHAVRFFGHLSFFAASMLGLVMANSLLLLFVCWELVGLASWLLIGHWARKESAVAAARKAFLTTRVGDLGLFLGLAWLSSSTGTLLFFDDGQGILEDAVREAAGGWMLVPGLALSTAVTLLAAWGAFGKSGQLPLQGWLPDAMEGPTPVSALIHAATMVAAGVFLLARLHPLMEAQSPESASLVLVAWAGSLTALLAALMALFQNDIKRILAWSTVSQLGFMMLALGTGGPAPALFHLLAHAFFKALLFLGAGSVIHACGGEQDVRRMGGLARALPVTFATYALGMLCLSGFPLLSGFWSKDEILHAAAGWGPSQLPFCLALAASFLTALYMTRQMVLVFLGSRTAAGIPRESPRLMTVPLAALASASLAVGFLGTPVLPLVQAHVDGVSAQFSPGALLEGSRLGILALSSLASLSGIALGWFLYRARRAPAVLDRWPTLRFLIRRQFLFEYLHTAAAWASVAAGALLSRLERALLVRAVEPLARGLGRAGRCTGFLDERGIGQGLRGICRSFQWSGAMLAGLRNGRVQSYLVCSFLAMALALWLILWLGGS